MSKEILSLLAIVLTFYAFFVYARSIFDGSTKPHVFSWLIWGLTTCIVFFAQLSDDAGAGAWPIGVSGLITLGIAAMAFARRSEISITRSDYVFLITALATIPIWIVTSDAVWAVIIITFIDLLAFGPMVRKTYNAPYSESLVFICLMAVRNGLAILALENYSITTTLFPGAIGTACILFIIMVSIRRGGAKI